MTLEGGWAMKLRDSLVLCVFVLAPATALGAQETAPERPYAFTSSYFVGEWVDTENCSDARLVIKSDGNFTAPGGGKGVWSLDGNILTVSGNQGASSFVVLPQSRDRVLIYNQDGTVGYSIRC